MEETRRMLRADKWSEWDRIETDQKNGVSPPPIVVTAPATADFIDLVPPEKLTVGRMPLVSAIERRRSHRRFTGDQLSLEEVSFLLWATQGIQKVIGHHGANLRTTPSGGGRHPLETYLAVLRVRGIRPGLYMYDPLQHRLSPTASSEPLTPETLARGCRGQRYFDGAAVTFIWTVVPYRTYWRYAGLSAKVIAQDSGHVCQNLYLAATSIGAGTCAIGAYYQDFMDTLVGADGVNEFVIYVAPVGRIRPHEELDHDSQFRAKYSS